MKVRESDTITCSSSETHRVPLPYEENWILSVYALKNSCVGAKSGDFNPSTWGLVRREKDLWEFEATLVYIESSRLARAPYRDTISKKRQNKTTKTKIHVEILILG